MVWIEKLHGPLPHRGQGYERALLNIALDRVPRDDRTAFLTAGAHDWARLVFRRAGFREVGRFWRLRCPS